MNDPSQGHQYQIHIDNAVLDIGQREGVAHTIIHLNKLRTNLEESTNGTLTATAPNGIAALLGGSITCVNWTQAVAAT